MTAPRVTVTQNPVRVRVETRAPDVYPGVRLPARLSDEALDARYGAKHGRSVKDAAYGAVGDGVTDDAPAIQAAVNAARDVVRAGFGAIGTVVLPGGVYHLGSQVVQPPYVKVVTVGTVTFQTNVVADSAWRITPLADDPSPLYASLDKEQWNLGDPISGAGVIFVNVAGSPGTTVALELGSRSDLGGTRHMARYSLADIAIQGYHDGIRWNTYNHHIAEYRHIRIEACDRAVVIGSGGVASNSGENIAWCSSVFATNTETDALFTWNAPAIDMQFTDCSFDFANTVFLLNYGYQRVSAVGCHFEGINEGGRYTATGGISVSNVTTGQYPEIDLDACVLVSNRRGVRFRGNQYLTPGITNRNNNEFTYMQSANAYACDSSVLLAGRGYRTGGLGGPLLARILGAHRDPLFSTDAAATAGSALTHWARSAWGTVADVVDADSPVAGGKSMAVTVTGSGGVAYYPKAYATCRPGDVVRAQFSYKSSSASLFPTLTLIVHWYDSEKVEIANTAQQQTHANTVQDEWRVGDAPARWAAPAGAAFYRVYFQISTTGGDGSTVFRMSDCHACIE